MPKRAVGCSGRPPVETAGLPKNCLLKSGEPCPYCVALLQAKANLMRVRHVHAKQSHHLVDMVADRCDGVSVRPGYVIAVEAGYFAARNGLMSGRCLG